MPVHNEDIAAVFDEIADLLEIEGDNPFRIRAYRNGARTLRELGQDVRTLVERGEDITRLAGIGKNLAAKIHEILATGHCRTLDKLRRRLPADLAELLKLPGLGPKRVHALFHELDIHNHEQLERAARDGLIQHLPGFGAKTEARILAALQAHADTGRRFKLAVAGRYAEPLVAYLKTAPGVRKVEVAGSFRRCRETVGDLDILVIARHGRRVIEHFVAYDEVESVLSSGTTRATVVLRSGLQVDVRVVAAVSYGAALYYFTGSRSHNIAVRSIARRQGLKINEYGVFRENQRIAGRSEEEVFASVGLPWIPPELRENRGEIEAAHAGLLPTLVEAGDLRGDLHAHTNASDGHQSIQIMAAAARKHGLEYLAITDHSRRLTVAHGLDSRRLLAQMESIDAFNAGDHGITLLKGSEVDILEDGSLDLPDPVLQRLDIVIGAVHSRFDLTRAKQTRRILRAMDHPVFTLLAHPGGRLIGRREPYDVDMARIIHHARERGCFLELNAHPDRLDLLDTHCQLAREEGVLISINSDAHSSLDFDNLRFGIGQARRGWLEKQDVLNTRPLRELRQLLAATR
ncbi:MAG TPA: DNA polymerase/3'-5' exonuclease PolX [Gammaproteobacteria bacterium]|nr:DNA polymerase/3'-5' exonuclease PolX [Gammaproteobacteria bacterium]